MKKAIFIILILACCYIRLQSQSWIKVYNLMNCWANNIIEDYDNGYIISGTRNDGKYSFIIKTDINGNMIWNKTIGNGQYSIFARNIVRTYDNGYIIGGTTSAINNQYDIFLLKLNYCGEEEWCSINYTSNVNDDLGWCIQPLPDSTYIFLSEFNDLTHRIHLYHFDNIGNIIWHNYYLPDSLLFDENGYRLLIDKDGYIITGMGFYPDPGQSGGWQRPYIIKTDTLGLPLWTLIYGKKSTYHGNAVKSIVGASGNYYCAGRHYGENGDSPALIKYFHNGIPSYNSDLILNSELGQVVDVVEKDDTSLVFSGGWAFSTNGYGPAGLIKTDTFGNVIKRKEFLMGYGEQIQSTIRTFNNCFVSIMTHCTSSSCGIYAFKVNADLEYDSVYSHQYNYDSLCPHTILSDTIDLNCITVNTNNLIESLDSSFLRIFPNPATEFINIRFPKYILYNAVGQGVKSSIYIHNWENAVLEIYNIEGKKIIYQNISNSQYEFKLNTANWSKGLYFVRFSYKQMTEYTEKVIIE
jgi:hypothetical protein